MSRNPFLIRRLWWLPWALFFVALVIGTKRCAEWAAADEPKITQGFDPETWKPCPGRKPLRMNGHKYVWYCGPDPSGQDQNDAAAKPGKADAPKRETRGVGKRREDRAQKGNG